MVPAGNPVDKIFAECEVLLKTGDILIDGGNSHWKDTRSRAARMKNKNIYFLDCAVSGGILGNEKGYCLMSGGEKSVCQELEPVFKSLAQPNGYLYCGTSGAGHFVKMVHNGIEYSIMQAFGEGFELLKKSSFDLNLPKVCRVWQNGSLIQSLFLDWVQEILSEDSELSDLQGYVQDSGEC